MKKLIALAFTCLLLTDIGAQTVIQDKNVEVRDLTSFNSIKISGAFTVYISKGEKNNLAVSASDTKYRDNIITKVKNNTLQVSYSGSSTFSTNPRLRVYLSYTDLQKIDASGTSDIKFQDVFNGDICSISLSGASQLKAPVNLNTAALNLSGASNASLTGQAGNLKVTASGASDFKSPELIAINAEITLSGASDASVTVKEELEAKASGASTLKFKGNPFTVRETVSGASSIKRSDK